MNSRKFFDYDIIIDGKSLYRRYRPLKLSDVIGQEQVTKPLENSIKHGKINHAYLFIGPRGCGKTSVARILAHEVNDFKYEVEDDYVDIIEIDGASNRGIDNIRELREKVMIAPSSGKYKIYIIDEVHMLTKEAFNALLKTLEEPPKHAIFIMATTDAYKVPVTITSRAQVYTFKLASFEVMMDYLKSIVKKEKIKITDDALAVIIKRGGGSFRDTLSLLDQLSTLSDKEITKQMVITAMGLPQDEQITALLDEYISGDVVRITTILKDLLSSGVKAETLAEEIISCVVDEPKPGLLPLLAKLPEVKAPFAEAKLLVALTERIVPKPALKQISTSTAPSTAVSNQSVFSKPKRTTEKTEEPESDAQDNTAPKMPSSDPGSFNWEAYVERVKSLDDGVGRQLKNVRYELDDGVLHIYSTRNYVRSYLSRDKNKQVLARATNGDVKITIHDEKNTSGPAKKDAVETKLSDIMGGEVQNDGGKNPFE